MSGCSESDIRCPPRNVSLGVGEVEELGTLVGGLLDLEIIIGVHVLESFGHRVLGLAFDGVVLDDSILEDCFISVYRYGFTHCYHLGYEREMKGSTYGLVGHTLVPEFTVVCICTSPVSG